MTAPEKGDTNMKVDTKDIDAIANSLQIIVDSCEAEAERRAECDNFDNYLTGLPGLLDSIKDRIYGLTGCQVTSV
jgi:hypothetical protein